MNTFSTYSFSLTMNLYILELNKKTTHLYCMLSNFIVSYSIQISPPFVIGI